MQDKQIINDGFSIALDTVHGWGADFYERLPNIIVGIIIVVVFGFMARLIGKAISSYFTKKERIDLGQIIADFTFWILIFFGVLLAITIIVPSVKPANMLASLGIGSLAIGFAFKDILQNWMSGLLILLRMPFRRGDQVKIGEAEGTVMRIEPRATIIRTYDGRDIVVPNTIVYTNMIEVNTSQSQRRIEIDLTVGYAYDVRKMTKIIQNSLSQVEEVLKEPAPQILCWELGSTSLALRVRWWIQSQKSAEVISRSRVVQAIKEAFDANDIDPTDPQLIFYQETKPTPQQEADKSTVGTSSHVIVNDGPPPPEFAIDQADPESEAIKIDTKKETLLEPD